MKNAIITITDRHFQDGEEYSCELTTSGRYEITENGCTVIYNETDEEMTNCLTTLDVIGSQKITMTRSGKYNTEMIIEKDRRHTCFYSTPYGELIMGIYAKMISNEIGENGGTLKFAYTIDFNNSPASENELHITVAAKSQEE
ncbi:MAG: DUF1934 domain-containing protein [Ruminococcaceae bacterium]|nr:DUF1934 domain-containing protein [Oscillospiraceae bacterium]